MTEEQKRLVEDNIKLVNYFIYTYYNNFLGDEDIYQLACIGLIKAAKLWNPDRGSFSKYVYLRIRSEMSQYFQDSNRQKRKGQDDTLSLDVEVNDESSFKDLLHDEGFEDEIIQDCLLKDLLNQLTENEKEYVKLYYFEDMTYQQISDLKGKTRERCRQIVTRSVKKMSDFYYNNISFKTNFK